MKSLDIHDASPRPVMCVREEEENVYFPNASVLKKGKVYNMTKVIVYPFKTEVYLKEFPEMEFNSLQFGELSTLSIDMRYQKNR